MKINDTLFIIPARGGSKGLPRKNILKINGKPLICYTVDAAREVTNINNICVSTDDLEIKKIVENYGLKIPFLRPAALATDFSGTREVLLHAIDFYAEKLGKNFSKICLLQPTSPLRTSIHILEAHKLWDDSLDMVVSVKESKENPYTLNTENTKGFLEILKKNNLTRRQEFPKFWKYNGAIYFININSLIRKDISEFKKVKKYVMSDRDSLDIDNKMDFDLVSIYLKRN